MQYGQRCSNLHCISNNSFSALLIRKSQKNKKYDASKHWQNTEKQQIPNTPKRKSKELPVQQIYSIWKLYRSCSKLQQMQISSLHIGSELLSSAILPWKSMMIHWFPLMRVWPKKICCICSPKKCLFLPHVQILFSFSPGEQKVLN